MSGYDSEATKRFSLRENVKNRFRSLFRDIIDEQNLQKATQFLVVFDTSSLALISSILKMSDILDMGIIQIERLELKRKKMKKFHAIYVLEATESSVKLLQQDFAGEGGDYHYSKAYVYFTNRVSKRIMQNIAKCEPLMRRLLACKELNHEFELYEQNLYMLRQEDYILHLYADYGGADEVRQTKKLAQRLTTIVGSLGEVYTFHIVNRKGSVAQESLAQLLKVRLEKIAETMRQNSVKEYDPSAGDVYFYLCERAIDPLTPIMHDFYYQSLLYDLMDITDDRLELTYKTKDAKNGESIETRKMMHFDDTEDTIFNKYRYQYIANCMDQLGQEFNNFIQSNTTSKQLHARGNNPDLEAMAQYLQSAPHYAQMVANFLSNYQLMDEIWQRVVAQNLIELGELEQSLATGIDKQAKQTKSSKLVNTVFDLLNGKSIKQPQIRLRLAIIVWINVELSSKDQQTLLKFFSPEEQQTILNIKYLGVKEQNPKNSNATTKRVDDRVRDFAKKRYYSTQAQLDRHTPYLYPAVDLLLNNILEKKPFEQLNYEDTVVNARFSAQDEDQDDQQKKNSKPQQKDRKGAGEDKDKKRLNRKRTKPQQKKINKMPNQRQRQIKVQKILRKLKANS